MNEWILAFSPIFYLFAHLLSLLSFRMSVICNKSIRVMWWVPGPGPMMKMKSPGFGEKSLKKL